MPKSLRRVLFGLIAFTISCQAQYGDNAGRDSDSTSITTTSWSTPNNAGTGQATPTPATGACSSRTINYITHILPQQCLRADRAAATVTKSTGADESGHVTADLSTVSSFTTDSTNETLSSATTASSATDSGTSSTPDTESDSPLDNANFLSFEEWKRQNQAEAEQAAEQGQPVFHGGRQRPGINNALDSLGDEGEIELPFSGFGSGVNGPRQQQAAYKTLDASRTKQSAPASHTPRSKDAGKTCKERTNYASFDCAASVLKTNPECKSPSSVLVENKDTYMLNTCSATNKFFIVELCNDILIDTVVLANYEFFSSIFRHFRVSVSDKYPVKLDKWRDLGTFEARNSREVQAFLIQHPQIWARYVRIEFLTHYGSEYYCPVSLFRVHGTTMLEDIRPQEEVVPGDSVEDEVALEAEAVAVSTISAVAQEPVGSTDELEKSTVQAIPTVSEISLEPSITTTDQSASSPTAEDIVASDGEETPSLTWTVNISGRLTSVAIPVPTEMTCARNISSLTNAALSKTTCVPGGSDSVNSLNQSTRTDREEERTSAISATEPESINSTHVPELSLNMTESKGSVQTASSALPDSAAVNGSFTSDLTSPSSTSSPPNTPDAKSKQPGSALATTLSTSTTSRPPPSTASTIPPPQPSTQESFFKSIHKRLQQLESNSTLSLQYIESQSRILRDAFSKVEKRQISATTSFLANLNATVTAELHGFRTAYDQIWQSTVIELEGQREHYQREMLALSSRLKIVADELVWQKRMGIVQSTLLLLCLGLVLFARSAQVGVFEVPTLQQMGHKSHLTSSPSRSQGWESPPPSPSPSSRSPARLWRRTFLWRSHTEPSVGTDSRPESKDGPELMGDLDVKVEPPTPSTGSFASPTPETEGEDEVMEDGVDVREVRSSPPTPTGMREHERLEKPPDLLGVGVDGSS